MQLDTQPAHYTIVGENLLTVAWNEIVEDLSELLLEHANGETSVYDVLQGIMAKRAQFWIATNAEHQIIAWAITRVVNYPQKRRLVIDYLGGKDMANWVHYSKFIEEFAAAQGCTEIEAWCRKGFTRTLKPHGFREAYTIMLKPVMRNLQ